VLQTEAGPDELTAATTSPCRPKTDKSGRPTARFETSELIALIKEHGAEHTILSSDLGQANSTHPVDGLQSTAMALLEAGISDGNVERLFVTNASQLLGYR